MNSIDTLKTDIRQWEKTFIKKYGRKPTKSDIATDKAIVKKYEKYKKLKSSTDKNIKSSSQHHHSSHMNKHHSDQEDRYDDLKKKKSHDTNNKKALSRSKSVGQLPSSKHKHHTHDKNSSKKIDSNHNHNSKKPVSSGQPKVLVVRPPNKSFLSNNYKNNNQTSKSNKKKSYSDFDSSSDSNFDDSNSFSNSDPEEDEEDDIKEIKLTEDDDFNEEDIEENDDNDNDNDNDETETEEKYHKNGRYHHHSKNKKKIKSKSNSFSVEEEDEDEDSGSETEVQDMNTDDIEEEKIIMDNESEESSSNEDSDSNESNSEEDDNDEDEDEEDEEEENRRNKKGNSNKNKSKSVSNKKLSNNKNEGKLKPQKSKSKLGSKDGNKKNSKQNTSTNTLVDKSSLSPKEREKEAKKGESGKKRKNGSKSKTKEEEDKAAPPRMLDILDINADSIYNRTPVTGVLRLRIVRLNETLMDRLYPRFALYNTSNAPSGIQLSKKGHPNNRGNPLPTPLLLARRRKKCKKPNYIISKYTPQTVKKSKENYVGTLRYLKEHSLYTLLDSRKYNPRLPNKGLKTAALIRFTNLVNHNIFVATPGLFYDTTKPIPDILNDVDFENEDNLFFLNSNPGPQRPRINTGKFGSKKFDPNKASNKYRCVNFTETSGEFFFSNYHQRKYNPDLSINDTNQPRPILFTFEQMNSTDYQFDVMHPLTPLEGFSIALSIISEMLEN
jgi:hypothetical protein